MLWVRTGRVGHVGTAGVDRVEAQDLVAQTAYVRGGSAGTWGVHAKGTAARWQAWQRRQGGGGYNNVDGTTEAAAVRCDGHGDINDDGLTCCSSWLRGVCVGHKPPQDASGASQGAPGPWPCVCVCA